MADSPGWDAIDGALRPLYGDTEPYHLATLLKWAVGGPDPLDGISVHARTEPVPHWHYISYGMTELYEKAEESDPAESGWGFEFTFRLVRDEADAEPPAWAANLLQNLARYVFTSGNWFEPGHHMNVNGPIEAEREDSDIRALAFVEDPELGTIATPHGRVQFLQVVGLTTDEYAAGGRWSTTAMLDTLAPHLPLFVTDPGRRSLLADPEIARTVQEGIERDGSSSGALYVSTVGWDRSGDATTLRLGALQATALAQALAGRLPYGRPLMLQGEDAVLVFAPGDAYAIEEPDEGQLVVHVPEAAVADLTAAIRPTAGSAPVPSLPGLTIEIVPTEMRDQYGEKTGEVIG